MRLSCRLAGAALASCALVAPSGLAQAQPAAPAKAPAAGQTTLEGQAFDRSGASLAGIAVRATLRSETVTLPWKPVEVSERVVASAVSDASGFFTLTLAEADLEGTLLLRCGDPAAWDAIRYAPPAERDVTARVRKGRAAVVNCVLEDAAGWNQLAREINQVGGLRTPRGKVLRARGLPPETVTLVDGVVEWRYPDAAYRFRGAELVEGPLPAGPKP